MWGGGGESKDRFACIGRSGCIVVMRCRSLVRMVASCVPACNLTGALAFVCRCPCASQVLTAIQWQYAPRSRTCCGRGLCLQRSSSIFDRSRWRACARLSLTVALFFRVLFGLRRALRCCFWWGDGDCCLGPRRRELTVRFGDVELCDDDRARARAWLFVVGWWGWFGIAGAHASRTSRSQRLPLVWAGRLLFNASGRTLVARRSPCSFRRRGECRSLSCGAVGLARALSRSLSSHSPQRRSRLLPVASLFGWAHARRSQSRDSRGIVGLVSMSNAASRWVGAGARARELVVLAARWGGASCRHG
jgi:hypothetical protein